MVTSLAIIFLVLGPLAIKLSRKCKMILLNEILRYLTNGALEINILKPNAVKTKNLSVQETFCGLAIVGPWDH